MHNSTHYNLNLNFLWYWTSSHGPICRLCIVFCLSFSMFSWHFLDCWIWYFCYSYLPDVGYVGYKCFLQMQVWLLPPITEKVVKCLLYNQNYVEESLFCFCCVWDMGPGWHWTQSWIILLRTRITFIFYLACLIRAIIYNNQIICNYQLLWLPERWVQVFNMI